MTVHLAILAVVSILLVTTGTLKLVGVPAMRRRAEHLGYSVTAFRIIGSLEIAGVAGMWWGTLGPEPLHPIATAALLVLMTGAVISHVRVGDRIVAAAPAIVVAALLVALLTLGVRS